MEILSTEKKSVFKKWMRNILIMLVIVLAGFIYFHYFFVLGKGVKAGELNYVVNKGYVFKTYEGKLIQTGFNNSSSIAAKGGPSIVQSNQFEFSIADKAVADSLMRCGGREVELSYKEYIAPVPWRGYSKYVVDKIIAVK